MQSASAPGALIQGVFPTEPCAYPPPATLGATEPYRREL